MLRMMRARLLPSRRQCRSCALLMSSRDDLNELVDVLCEFLQAVIAAILYLRSVYDRDLFQLHRLYGVAVHKCRHPDLNEYIESNVSGLRVRKSF